jgi:5-methylcytosine-specific restriction endonuclease McrA
MTERLKKKRARPAISKSDQEAVFRRDGWLCRWCGRPVIFAPALKYLDRFARDSGFAGPLAYHDDHWTRRNAPLLDHMGAVIDHIAAHSQGGPDVLENLATACNKCNASKSDSASGDFSRRSPRQRIKGKYGEPENWDGLSRLFVILAERAKERASASELDWLKCLSVESRR